MISELIKWSQFVKLSHTVFAMPFALALRDRSRIAIYDGVRLLQSCSVTLTRYERGPRLEYTVDFEADPWLLPGDARAA